MKYEEHKKWSTKKSWMFVFALSGSLLAWAFIMMTFVKDVPREWDFGNIEFTPAESVYSTVDVDEDSIGQQIEPLPEGVSFEEVRSNEKNVLSEQN